MNMSNVLSRFTFVFLSFHAKFESNHKSEIFFLENLLGRWSYEAAG